MVAATRTVFVTFWHRTKFGSEHPDRRTCVCTDLLWLGNVCSALTRECPKQSGGAHIKYASERAPVQLRVHAGAVRAATGAVARFGSGKQPAKTRQRVQNPDNTRSPALEERPEKAICLASVLGYETGCQRPPQVMRPADRCRMRAIEDAL